MSQPPPPPFDPRTPPPIGYPPQYPQPLGYAYQQGVGRPGIVTAVGVISIVMAILSFFGAIGSVLQAVWLQVMPGFVRTAGAMTTMPTTAPVPTPNPFSNFQFEWDAPLLLLGLGNCVLRLAAAILLVVAGIMVLRDARSGRKLHLWWAWLRIPLGVVGAVVYYVTMDAMMRNMTAAMGTMPGGPPPGAAPTMVASVTGAVFELAISCAYPVGVLIVMHTKRVKAFYQTLGT